jgi:hypothetical protein
VEWLETKIDLVEQVCFHSEPLPVVVDLHKIQMAVAKVIL